jgi:hypothetical protein
MSCRVDIDDLISFVFPENVQHPLTACRLYCYSLYGPADDDNKLRSGHRRSHILMEYELETMCRQLDKEDTISIFKSHFEELSNPEQSIIISQSDLKYRTSRGKAVFPSLTKDDLMSILKVWYLRAERSSYALFDR